MQEDQGSFILRSDLKKSHFKHLPLYQEEDSILLDLNQMAPDHNHQTSQEKGPMRAN